MERKININDEFLVLEHKSNNKQSTIVLDLESKESHLISTAETNEYVWGKTAYNDDYIMSYTWGVLANQFPVNVTGAFDIKKRMPIELDEVKKDLLSKIFIYGRSFDTRVILSIINVNNISFVSDEEIEDFINYVTNYDMRIMSQDILNHIFYSHPEFLNYTEIDESISDFEFNEILRNIGNNTWFNVMPMCMDYEMNNNLVK